MFDWKIFDKIYCIHYLPYKDRLEKITRELDRVGILNLPQFKWFYTTDNKIFDCLYETMLNMKFFHKDRDVDNGIIEGYIQNKNVFNLAMNEFNMLQQAYNMNYQRILILEDDLSFLKDMSLINDYMNDFPLDYDIVSMDYWFRGNEEYQNVLKYKSRFINEHFRRFYHERIVNASCVSLSRNAILHWLNCMKQKFMCSDYYIANQNMFSDGRLKRAISKIPICIQNINAVSNHNASEEIMKWKYNKKIQIDLALYENNV